MLKATVTVAPNFGFGFERCVDLERGGMLHTPLAVERGGWMLRVYRGTEELVRMEARYGCFTPKEDFQGLLRAALQIRYGSSMRMGRDAR